MATAADLFRWAVHHHQTGNILQAEQLYRQVLQANPRHADALHLLGVLALDDGRIDHAAALIRQAVELNPANAIFRFNLGQALEGLGRSEDAIRSFEQALALQADLAEAHLSLGNIRLQRGDLAEAENHYRKAVSLRPDFAGAHNNLGNVFREQRRFQEAEACFRLALSIDPSDAEAHNNVGIALADQDRFDEAIASYRQALQINPGYADAQKNMGLAFLKAGNAQMKCRKFTEALELFRLATRLNPDCAEAHNNFCSALCNLERFEEAALVVRQALKLRPDIAEAHLNLGNALGAQKKYEDAIRCYDEAVRLRPDSADVHFNRALLWLLHGDFEHGWPEYEWRWQTEPFVPFRLSQPIWDGAPLDGRTILIVAEQGLGDTLQFVRYASMVKLRGGHVVFQCQPALLRLMKGVAGIDELVSMEAPTPPSDVHVPLLTLPGIFQTNLATIPAAVPYIHAEAGLIASWQRQLEALEKAPGHAGRPMRIGIVWQGSKTLRIDKERSIPLARFAPLAAVKGVRLISLQYGAGTEQLGELGGEFPVLDLVNLLGPATDSMANIAAVIKNLDVVVSCDTAIAHLAGALATKVFVALPWQSEWRWLINRDDSPWYPTMRLFRQSTCGVWQDVMERMASAVAGIKR